MGTSRNYLLLHETMAQGLLRGCSSRRQRPIIGTGEDEAPRYADIESGSTLLEVFTCI